MMLNNNWSQEYTDIARNHDMHINIDQFVWIVLNTY